MRRVDRADVVLTTVALLPELVRDEHVVTREDILHNRRKLPSILDRMLEGVDMDV